MRSNVALSTGIATILAAAFEATREARSRERVVWAMESVDYSGRPAAFGAAERVLFNGQASGPQFGATFCAREGIVLVDGSPGFCSVAIIAVTVPPPPPGTGSGLPSFMTAAIPASSSLALRPVRERSVVMSWRRS
jgi:hypothetical protein